MYNISFVTGSNLFASRQPREGHILYVFIMRENKRNWVNEKKEEGVKREYESC